MAEAIAVTRTIPEVRTAVAARCTVRVPASTSNLGAGFDCVGVAVDRWLTVHATCAHVERTQVARAGTLTALEILAEHDLIVRGFVTACERAGVYAPSVQIDATSDIPVGRGLGSSAAACVAGALAANALLDLAFDADAIITVAARIEGHPDNVAPSVRGGAILGVRIAPPPHAAWHVAQLRVDSSLRLVFAIPGFEIATRAARLVLPREVDFGVAVDAAGRAAALVQGLATGDASLLRAALDDVLHVPHRRALVPAYDQVVAAAVDAGAIGATLSGSGSSLVAIAHASSARRVASAMVDAWSAAGIIAESLVSAGEVTGATVSTERR